MSFRRGRIHRNLYVGREITGMASARPCGGGVKYSAPVAVGFGRGMWVGVLMRVSVGVGFGLGGFGFVGFWFRVGWVLVGLFGVLVSDSQP